MLCEKRQSRRVQHFTAITDEGERVVRETTRQSVWRESSEAGGGQRKRSKRECIPTLRPNQTGRLSLSLPKSLNLTLSMRVTPTGAGSALRKPSHKSPHGGSPVGSRVYEGMLV